MSKSSEEKLSEVQVGSIGSSYLNPIFYYDIECHTRAMAGRILTVIDASISDKIQNKAIKDLVKGEIRTFLDTFQNIGSEGKEGHTVRLEAVEGSL